MATINYERNVKYFKSVSYKPGIILIIAGIILLLIGNAGTIVVGLLAGGIGVFLIYQQVADRPSDDEIDRQVSSVISELRLRGMKKLGLHADEVDLIPPIVVGGRFYGAPEGGLDRLVKRGKDGRVRSSVCEGVVIFFAEQELHAYKYQVSLVAEDETRELTDVYFYHDVVSVSTRSSSISLPLGEGKKQVVQFELFSLTTSGGTSVECTMDGTANGVSRDIQGARQLIRNKKMHAS